jgi:hypothetical protein
MLNAHQPTASRSDQAPTSNRRAAALGPEPPPSAQVHSGENHQRMVAGPFMDTFNLPSRPCSARAKMAGSDPAMRRAWPDQLSTKERLMAASGAVAALVRQRSPSNRQNFSTRSGYGGSGGRGLAGASRVQARIRAMGSANLLRVFVGLQLFVQSGFCRPSPFSGRWSMSTPASARSISIRRPNRARARQGQNDLPSGAAPASARTLSVCFRVRPGSRVSPSARPGA